MSLRNTFLLFLLVITSTTVIFASWRATKEHRQSVKQEGNRATTQIAELARQYVAAFERGAGGEEVARFFTPDVVIEEMPNRIGAHGNTYGLDRVLQGATEVKKVYVRQNYTIKSLLVDGTHVALELDWVGLTAVPIANIPVGTELRNHIALFLDFRDGRIAKQRNYECFEPW
jgi:ketosteroid isomerase-like protein